MKSSYYVYGLYAPGRSPELFYVGKGKGRRAETHLWPSRKGFNPYKDNVIAKYPGCYVSILKENLTEQEAFALEVKLVADNKDTITNMTSGGEGSSGRKHSAQTKLKISEAQRGEKSHRFGKAMSTDAKAKLAITLRGDPRLSQPGEDNPRAKLTWVKVREIRDRLAQGETQQAIANDYGIARSQIGLIKNNKTWKIECDPNHISADHLRV